jgi:hypothetical protein
LISTPLKHPELIVAINQSNIETIINKDCEIIKKIEQEKYLTKLKITKPNNF